MEPGLPADWTDITPEWMSAALQKDLPGVVVADVGLISRDDGTNRRARMRVTYAAGDGPGVVFLKGEGAWRESHAKNGNLFNEPELFAARVLLPVDHPRPYHVVIDRPALDYVIVMEDVTLRGAEPRDATSPMSVEQAEHGVRSLAALHSAYWDLSLSHPGFGWLQTWRPTEGWRSSLTPGLPVGFDRAAEILPAEVRATPTDVLLDLCMRSMQTFGDGWLTLLHADPHIGNTYVLPDNGVGFLDWQVCRRGSWAQDLSYFLVSALTVADRQAHERRLLDSYLDALTVPSDQRPDKVEVWDRYSATHPYGLVVWLATHQSDRAQRPEVCRALIDRFATAFVDGESSRALSRLSY